MSDKVQKIKEEIEKRIEKYGPDFKTPYDAMYQLLTLLDFIDSLPEQPASEDLEEELHSWMRENCDDNGFFNQLELARHFAEWQKQKDQETIELAEDHAMLAGMSNMKEEMMKDAIEGWCINDGHILNDIRTLETEKANLKVGDEVKIIIVKTEQK